MKKLMLTAAACAAMAFGASADFSVAELTKDLPEGWGYATEGLGAKGDEVALVFTNTSFTSGMSVTLPDFVHEVRYLVVGGGGAGGASGNSYGAGGGGAGGVVQNATPLVLAGGETVAAVVGAGAPKVSGGTHGGNGNKSTLTIGGNTFTAYRGAGGGQGATAGYGNSATSSQPMACGGGSGGNYGRDSDSYIAGGAGDVSNGGIGHGGGGGGGGAGGNGYDWNAGGGMAHVGGPGVVTTIFTDEEQTIAGGGCGNGGRDKITNPSGGGGYAGSIDSYSNFNAGDGTTWGAGGGAGTASAKSGAGHQGVVVVRFSTTVASTVPVQVPVIASKAYTGETLTADIEDADAYEVSENAGGVNAGTYDVVLHLKDHEPPYAWQDDGSTDDRTLSFVITKTTDSWATSPSLSKTAWAYSDEPATVTVGVSARGETAVVTYDDGLGVMPGVVGNHTATFTVAAGDNYEKLETVINFAINKDANVWTVEPSVTPDTWVRGEGSASFFNAPAAKYGETVTVVYDNDPVKVEPEIAELGEHTVKYSVDAGETYEGLETTIAYTVTKKINGWETAPVVSDGNIEDGLPEFTPPTAMNGGEVTVWYDGDKTIVEPPTAMGNHTVTYEVAEDEGEDGYQGYTQTIAYKVTYKPVFDQTNPSVVCGYRLPGLGAGGNEVAVVFTNTAAGTMTFALPQYVSEISYLVVGGGASGGRTVNAHQAGGGGAGGVVTNNGPYAVEGGSVLAIAVGAGGAGVTADGKNGNSGHPSSLTIADETFVALKGGYGGCYSVNGAGGGGADVACGGGAGGYNGTSRAGGDGVISDGMTTSGAGGGGGAGGDATSVVGGVGVPVTIFGDTYPWDDENGYYIAAGGTGAGRASNGAALGGGGAGGVRNGSYYNDAAKSGSRWGAGGGGTSGSGCYPSGAGYQGVVVVRYAEEANVAVMPAIPETMYSGEQQVAQLVGGQGFEVVENEGGVEAGTNEVVIALADGYSSWEDGVTDTQRTLDFVITKADHNEWNPVPSISKGTWTTSDENPGVLTAGRTTFGPVTATYTRNGVEQGEFDGTLPTGAGTYVIAYVAPDETDSYVTVAEGDKVKTVEFMIVMANAVAKVGEYDTYETVADAFAAAKDGDTVLMLQDATVDAAVEVTNDVTLVLAGYEVSADGRDPDTLFLVKDGAVLTLDGSAAGSQLSGGVCVASGTLNMTNTTIVAAGDAIVAGSEGNVTLNLGEGNKVTSVSGYAIRETYADAEATAVHSISVTGGSYSGELGTFVATGAFDAAMEAGTATCAFVKANYTKPIDVKYVADGHLQKKLENGAYCIGPAADTEALTYTWNGNGDTNLWQAANWSINKDLAPDAYVGFPNNYNLATARFASGDEPVEVKLAADVAVKCLTHAANAPEVTIDLDGHTLTHNLSESTFGAGVAWQYFTLRAQSGKGPLTFKNGAFVLPSGGKSTGELLLDANSHVYFDNVSLPTTGKSFGATYRHKDVAVTFRNGCEVAGLNCYGGEDFLLEVDNSTATIDPGMDRSKNAHIVVRNGGTLQTSQGAFDYNGEYVTIQVEGEGSSANLVQSSYSSNGFSAKNWTLAALDGAEVSLKNIAHTFTSDPSGYDNGTRFVVSNATFKATGSVPFCFGIHTTDATCVSPTIALAGNSPKFSTSCAFTFGSAAMELANPPVLELMPAPGGFAEPAISTTKNSYSLTIGSNVVVRVDVSDLKARGALRAKMAIAAVPADGTAELKVDLDRLAANTTVNDENSNWRVAYKLSQRDGRKVLTARVTSGGFLIQVR